MANEKIAVLCKNEQEWEDTKLKAGKAGIMSWSSAKYYDDICVYVYDEHKGCDPQEACIRNGYEIITAEQYNTGPSSRAMSKRIAVHCETEEEWNAVGAKSKAAFTSAWRNVNHHKDICIYVETGGFDRKEDCLRLGHKIITAREYLGLAPRRVSAKNRAVLCETANEWNAVRLKAKKGTGVPHWNDTSRYSNKCIYVDSVEGFDEKQDCICRGNTVITASEYLNLTKKKGSLGINFNNIVGKMSPGETVDKSEPKSMWKPIETAPKNKYIMVRGDSGTSTYPKFYVVAIFIPEYRDEWVNIHNNRLTDSGYIPEEWAEVPK